MEVSYTIVIPRNVAEITEAGVYVVGQAKVNEATVEGATENTVIFYTASVTNFVKDDESSKSIAATYYTAYTDKENNTVFDGTKAIAVYRNNQSVDDLTTLYVGISEEAWDAAEVGTYTATVTYNFTAEEVEPK